MDSWNPLPVPNSLHGLCARKATLNSNYFFFFFRFRNGQISSLALKPRNHLEYISTCIIITISMIATAMKQGKDISFRLLVIVHLHRQTSISRAHCRSCVSEVLGILRL